MLRGELVALENDETPPYQILAFHFRNGKGFEDLLHKKRTALKTLLMDQKAMRGIGNSYADEILYHAGISPFSIANVIPAKQVVTIFKSIQTVLNKAVKNINEAGKIWVESEEVIGSTFCFTIPIAKS